MRKYWEADVFLYLAILSGALLILSVVHAWIKDRQRWNNVRPHYGSVFDASERTVRPRANVRLVRRMERQS